MQSMRIQISRSVRYFVSDVLSATAMDLLGVLCVTITATSSA